MNDTIDNPQFSIAAIQMNSQQNIESNLADIQSAIIDAKSQGAELVVIPENCCSMGQQFATAERFDALSATMADYARTHGIYLLAGSLPCPYRPDGAVVPDGRLRQVSQLFAPDGTRLSTRAVQQRLKVAATRAGIAQNMYPHLLRHRLA